MSVLWQGRERRSGLGFVQKTFLVLGISSLVWHFLFGGTSPLDFIFGGTSPLGSLQQVWSSLQENDGSCGHLWLPLFLRKWWRDHLDQLYYFFYNGSCCLSLCVASIAHGGETKVDTHLVETPMPCSWAEQLNTIKVKRRRKLSWGWKSLILSFWSLVFFSLTHSLTDRRYMGHCSMRQRHESKSHSLNRNLFQCGTNVLESPQSRKRCAHRYMCICNQEQTLIAV